jgi:hypothetical protein
MTIRTHDELINYLRSDAYQIPARAHDKMAEPIKQAFYAALTERVGRTEGLTINPAHNMPWLAWESDPLGGYWLGYGIEFRMEDLPEHRRSFRWLSDLHTGADDEIDQKERPLDIWMSDTSSRDPELLADMVLSALTRHQKTQP